MIQKQKQKKKEADKIELKQGGRVAKTDGEDRLKEK